MTGNMGRCKFLVEEFGFYSVLLLVQFQILLMRTPTELLRGQGTRLELEFRTSELQLSSMHLLRTHTHTDEQRSWGGGCFLKTAFTHLYWL